MPQAGQRVETLPRVEEIAARIREAPPEVPDKRAEIARVVASIAETVRPRRIVLYGSWAYGTPTAESDVDLMVEMDGPGSPHDEGRRIQQAISSLPSRRVHVVVFTPKQVRRDLREHSFFMRDIMLKGIALYEREGMDADDEGLDDLDDDPNDDMPGIKHVTQRWLRTAERDYRIATRLLDDDDPDFNNACFHAQQSAEKNMKALLQEHAIEFPRTHNLAELADLAQSVIPELTSRGEELERLTECAVAARYIETDIKAAAANEAERIAAWVRALVRRSLGVPEDK